MAAQPWADGKRVMVSFAWEGEGPVDVEIILFSAMNDVWARMLIVELNAPRWDATLHVRGAPPGAEGVAQVRLLKGDDEVDCRAEPFALPVQLSAPPSDSALPSD
jgi:hypothetical protein